ncbi:MAG TPA: VapC toxin family PIN domain ribonuclease [Alphaproteobacteria bacterium]|nr:VapC toxin family PIN domain ribonuclease [Alphaproteobacteria bacterium]HAJ46198.1 VapC toxin family PIN domain ribonuclease [Alphaproteobacteria bacterium]
MNFFDTNILIYALSGDDYRSDRAVESLSEGGIISAQVLSEFTNTVLKKMKRNWRDVEQALKRLELVVIDVVPLTRQTHASAVALARMHMLEWFDALILAAALDAGCERLITEDFQSGRKFGKLKIENPFV